MGINFAFFLPRALPSPFPDRLYLESGKARILRGVFGLVLLSHSLAAVPASLYAASGTTARISWRHLLYYSPRWLRHDSSLIDSPEFFLAPDGASNSDHELDAFLEALKNDDPNKPENERLACRFPARTLWVQRFRPEVKFLIAPCAQYDAWRAISNAKAVSLVFSSYYINNPSSMMGHSFLRLRRGAAKSAPLLDKAVNFAAEPTTDIAMLYSIMGLTGSFPGKFTLMPYYSKVQEYANAESRDLWEYDLNFDEAETTAMMASLWELAPLHIDYFYFDENCSAVLMYLLQTARPELRLSESLGSFVHPSDTLRILMAEPGLVSDIVYRPSSRSRYLAQFKILSEEEKAIVSEYSLKDRVRGEAYSKLPLDRKAAVLDALLSFIEFDEGLYGSKKPLRYADLYEDVLQSRSVIKSEPLIQYPSPEDEAPHLGHKGQRWGLAAGRYQDQAEVLLEYRPGQHDLLSPSLGYPPELSIELGKTRMALQAGGTARLRSAELFHILSFNPMRSGRLPWSWQLQLDYENTEAKRVNFLASLGQALAGGLRDHYAFAFFNTHFKVEKGSLWACPGATIGGRWTYGKYWVQYTQVSLERCYSEIVRPWLGFWSHSYRWSLSPSWELSIEAKKSTDSRELALGFYRYF